MRLRIAKSAEAEDASGTIARISLNAVMRRDQANYYYTRRISDIIILRRRSPIMMESNVETIRARISLRTGTEVSPNDEE